MKLIFIIFIISLILFVPIPIKIIIYYSSDDYYIKIYKLTIISKKRPPKRDKPIVKKEHSFFTNVIKKFKYNTILSDIYTINLKYKPLLKFNFSLDFSLNDAAKTSITYGLLGLFPSLVYFLLKFLFHIKNFNLKINPIFEDKFLLKIESSSIIFLSFANIIYIIIIFLRTLSKRRRWTPNTYKKYKALDADLYVILDKVIYGIIAIRPIF